MTTKFRLLVSVLILTLGVNAVAKVDTCRELIDIKSKDIKVNTELFIIIDETTYFNDKLKNSIVNKVKSVVREGVAISIYKFSQLSHSKYPEKVKRFVLEKGISEYEDNENKRSKIKKLKKCLKKQNIYVNQNIDNVLNKTFRQKDKKLQNSDIFVSLQYISENAIASSRIKNKIVLIASDMLENSTYTSFYANGKLKNIDKDKELKLVEKEDLLGDYGDASIYVSGAGIVDVESNKLRDHKELRNLNRFWKKYFQKSNGRLVEFSYANLLQNLTD